MNELKDQMIEFFQNEFNSINEKYQKVIEEKVILSDKIKSLDKEKVHYEEEMFKLKTGLNYFGIFK